VHNGIIENHATLREFLKEKGHQFESDTDTEVLTKLIGELYNGNILKAVEDTLPLIEGSFAVALIHANHPGQIVAFAKEAPLAVGIGNGECYVSSDPNALGVEAKEVIYLGNNELVLIGPGVVELFDENLIKLDRKTEELVHRIEEISKGDFAHYTLKEIHEQPQTLRNVVFDRYFEDYGTASFEELTITVPELLAVERVVILGCGTSWHAGFIGQQMIQEFARIPTSCEISSEYRYDNPIILPGTLVLAISQSGETADTIAAMRELKAKGARIVAICNVHGSTIAREADSCLFLRAGPEIGVCSTKAFTSQVALLALFGLLLGRLRHMSKEDGQHVLSYLKKLPEQVEEVLAKSEEIQEMARKYARYENFFFVGRRYMYPACLEGALKLKEISYINANGYAAGEMKHGPIALINEICPTVAFTSNKQTYAKIISNLMEIKARSGPIIAIAEEGAEGLESVVDEIIRIPNTIDPLTTIPATVAAQLLAYYIALERGEDIDQPRNLAKSVTVE
jgi:glucosamine--fructose-6-phosphate aminotransferase (isomerizing)